ncbi:ferric reductase like transmembrane component-domain-containing protein [Annulohypoxylon truncatum]|uniref:ferric reductase like transmembrane component-domain-containing protein n=1 Tax=Annulohypoxylon truncatum TaxID=327061 RepID=UPI002008D7B1|nr:ferric reductase like transmembrane component-domain-containing protein [Annulohypoxylon truncatum]KAI1205175.1 ferric reductase like transmembrane component-domain-containing protein [Annulohypoxylon truncatum]
MSMSMGDDHSMGNVTGLPLSDPRCDSDACDAFKAAHQASQAAVSYDHQYDYGHYTTWYYLAVIGVATVVYSYRLYRNRIARSRTSTPQQSGRTTSTLAHKILAVCRFVNYRHSKGPVSDYFGFPSLGTLAFLGITSLFLLLMTFLVHPYYRGRRGYGSPPLAVRTGLMAQALTPIIVALAGKVNFITMLTGISHEKLNVFHRWVSYMCLFLSIVHTVPFIVQPLKDGGAAALRKQYYKPGGMEYTGTPPLGILVGIVVLSIPWIRHRFYNFFYRLHIPMYVVYLGLLFWHSKQEKDSWVYLYATLAIWLASCLVRLFYKWQTFSIFRDWFHGLPSRVEELPGGMTKVTVLAPADFRWKPGQHCWIRIPHLSILQNHPFTIANLPKIPSAGIKRDSDVQEIILYVRAHQGLTLDLLKSVENHDIVEDRGRSVSIHVDGPYGGIVEDVPALYESLIFVAGGSGISACLPWIQYTARRVAEGSAAAKNIHLIWMVRYASQIQWITEELEPLINAHPDLIQVDFFVTNSSSPTVTSTDSEKNSDGGVVGGKPSEKSTTTVSPKLGQVHNERPYLPNILPPLLTARRCFILGCGPESLRTDLANAASAAQKKVLTGEVDIVTLHTESFGW